jgi:hypothetical protein
MPYVSSLEFQTPENPESTVDCRLLTSANSNSGFFKDKTRQDVGSKKLKFSEMNPVLSCSDEKEIAGNYSSGILTKSLTFTLSFTKGQHAILNWTMDKTREVRNLLEKKVSHIVLF